MNENNPKKHHIKKHKAERVLNLESKIKIDNKTEYFILTVFYRRKDGLYYYIQSSDIKKSVRSHGSKVKKQSTLSNRLSKNKITKKTNTNKKGLKIKESEQQTLFGLNATARNKDTIDFNKEIIKLKKEVTEPKKSRKKATKTVSKSKPSQEHKKEKIGQMALFGAYDVPKNPTIEDTIAFAEKYLVDESIYHKDIGKKIYFSKSGVKKSIRGKRGVSKIRLQLVYLAKQILESSRLIKIEKDKKERKQVLNIYKLNCFHTINGQEYRIFITLRENVNKTLYYDHEAVKFRKYIRKTGNDFKESNSTPLCTANVLSKNKITKKNNTNKKGLKIKESEQQTLFGLNATARNKDTIDFNKEILNIKNNKPRMSEELNLGKTKGILKKYIGEVNLYISKATIYKAMNKDLDHIAQWHNFINLPDNINNPVAIFKSKGYGVLIETVSYKNKPLMIAIHINSTFKISKIASIYARKNTNIYKKWKKEGLAVYVNKKCDWLNYASATIAAGSSQSRYKDTKKTNTNTKGLGAMEPKSKDSKDLLGYMNFKSKLIIDGEKRHVRVVVEVFKDKRTLLKTYDVGSKKPRLSKESPKLSSSLNEVKNKSVTTSKQNKIIKKNNTNKKRFKNKRKRATNFVWVEYYCKK